MNNSYLSVPNFPDPESSGWDILMLKKTGIHGRNFDLPLSYFEKSGKKIKNSGTISVGSSLVQ